MILKSTEEEDNFNSIFSINGARSLRYSWWWWEQSLTLSMPNTKINLKWACRPKCKRRTTALKEYLESYLHDLKVSKVFLNRHKKQ